MLAGLRFEFEPHDTLRIDPVAVTHILAQIIEREIGKNDFLARCGITVREVLEGPDGRLSKWDTIGHLEMDMDEHP